MAITAARFSGHASRRQLMGSLHSPIVASKSAPRSQYFASDWLAGPRRSQRPAPPARTIAGGPLAFRTPRGEWGDPKWLVGRSYGSVKNGIDQPGFSLMIRYCDGLFNKMA